VTAPPVVSVVLAVRNEERDIAEQLRALAHQSFPSPWELVVIDNGSRDATVEIVRSWHDRLPPLRVELAPERPNVAAARNRGVRASTAPLLLFCDGDDVVDERWVEVMVDGLRDHAVVTGARDYRRLNPRWATPYLPDRQESSAVGGAPEVFGNNFGVRREVWDALGGMAEDVPHAEDVDFGLRAAAAGVDVGYISDSLVHRRVPHHARDVFRQHYGYGRGQVVIAQRHLRPRGRGDGTRVVREYAFLVVRAYWLLSRPRRLHWAMVAGRHAGRLVESARRRVFVP
jgi:glycosyltransferase involved in cell wall biosynthesis